MNNTNWRSILVTVISGLIIMLGERFGLGSLAQSLVGVIGGSYVGGDAIAAANPYKRLQTLGAALKSKKFRVTLITLVVIVLVCVFGGGVSPGLAILVGGYNILQGIKDRAEIPPLEDFIDEQEPEPTSQLNAELHATTELLQIKKELARMREANAATSNNQQINTP